ncbi:MAG: SH3 domain-containing protein [Dehalococcoidia bacterium]
MRRTSLITVALMLAGFVAALAFAGRVTAIHAAPSTPDTVVVTMRYGAALRLAPSSDADISTVAACGATFGVAAEQDGWYAVYAANQTLWVGGGRVADAATNVPDCSDAVTFQVNSVAMVHVQSGCLSLRSAPSRMAAYSQCVEDGHIYTIQSGPLAVSGEDWFQVWSDSTGDGWVLADYLTRIPT